MNTPHTYLAFLSGHEHLSGAPDNGGAIPAGLPNAGLGEAEINHRIAERAAELTGGFLLPHDLGATNRLSYASQMEKAEALAAKRAAESGVTDWRLMVVHVHADMGAHRNRLLFFDNRSRWGQAAVASMVELSAESYVQRVCAYATLPDLHPDQDDPNDWLSRAYNCINGAWSLKHTFAVLVEVGNMRSKQHAPMWEPEGLEKAAVWLAEATRLATA